MIANIGILMVPLAAQSIALHISGRARIVISEVVVVEIGFLVEILSRDLKLQVKLPSPDGFSFGAL